MPSVEYSHEFPYRYDDAPDEIAFPKLRVTIAAPAAADQIIEIDAYLDSGATQTFFQGELAPALGLDLFAGEAKVFLPTQGPGIDTRLHQVRFSAIDDIPVEPFVLTVGFSTGNALRNLLGRDFFNHIQVGFRERQLTLYLTPNP